jgi:hypothetical protein
MYLKILQFCLPIVLYLSARSVVAAHANPPLLEHGDSILFIGNSKVGSEGGLQHHFRRALAKAEPSLLLP